MIDTTPAVAGGIPFGASAHRGKVTFLPPVTAGDDRRQPGERA